MSRFEHNCIDGWKARVAASHLFCSMCGAKLIDCHLEPREIVFVLNQQGPASKKLQITNLSVDRGVPLSLVSDTPAVKFAQTGGNRIDLAIAPASTAEAILQFDNQLSPSEEFAAEVTAYLPGRDVKLDRVRIRGGHEPQFHCEPPRFSAVEAGSECSAATSIRHVGGLQTTIRSIKFEPPSGFDQIGLLPGMSFAKGTEASFEVICRTSASSGAGSLSSALQIDFDLGQLISIPCTIQTHERSELRISSPDMTVPVGIQSDAAIKIRALGAKPIRIVAVEFPDNPAWLRFIRATLPITVHPGTEPLELRYVVQPQPDWQPGQKLSTACVVKSDELEPTKGTVNVRVAPATPFEHFVGIDFGTTNSCVAYWDDREQRVGVVKFRDWSGTLQTSVPSLAYFDERSGAWLAGFDALAKADEDGRHEAIVHSVKRYLNEGLLSDRRKVPLPNSDPVDPEPIATALIQYLKVQAERHLGKTVDNVVITLPANFTDVGVRATLSCASAAGLAAFDRANAESWNDFRLDEPTAAAIEATATKSFNLTGTEEIVLVFDFGGGTLDVSILLVIQRKDIRRVQVLAHKGANWLGGDDFTLRVIKLIVAKFSAAFPASAPRYDVAELKWNNQWNELDSEEQIEVYRNHRILWEQAEGAKLRLSTEEAISLAVNLRVHGTTQYFETTITRSEFEAAISDLVDDSLRIVRRTIARANESRPIDLDSITRVIATGKTSLIPVVRRRLAGEFGLNELERHDGFDEKECVSRGATQYAFQNLETVGAVDEARLECLDLHERTNCSYGIIKSAGVQAAQVQTFKPLIHEGTLLTCQEPGTDVVSVSRNPLVSATIPVYQHTGDLSEEGADIIEKKNRDVVPIDAIRIPIREIPPNLRGKPVKISMRLAGDGMLQAEASVEGHDRVFRLDERYGA